MKAIEDVATRGERAVVQRHLLNMMETATGENCDALKLAADVLRVLDVPDVDPVDISSMSTRDAGAKMLAAFRNEADPLNLACTFLSAADAALVPLDGAAEYGSSAHVRMARIRGELADLALRLSDTASS